MIWRNIYRGMIMGMTDLIPGVSGGTIAMILGIYNQLITGLNQLFSKEWKKEIGFFLPLLIGILISFLLLSNVMETLLRDYPQPTYFFFIGLIIGLIPYLFQSIQYKKTFTRKHYTLVIVSALVVASTVFFSDNEVNGIVIELGWDEFITLFFSGWLASTAMLLPGVSGSFVLLVLGVYPTVIHGLSVLNFAIISAVGLGILVGLIVTGKVIYLLFKRFKVATYAVMVGLLIGSIVVIYPGFQADMKLAILSVTTFIFGVIGAMLLGKYEYR
ncbi:DUF368 domain-containing protein [Bacillus solimangrovi]|nr:DUF368 domain-containing protein [Bacillus solimangrovi]